MELLSPDHLLRYKTTHSGNDLFDLKQSKRSLTTELAKVIRTLEVNVVLVSKHKLSAGERFIPPPDNGTSLVYVTRGAPYVVDTGEPALPLRPHSLFIAPPHRPFGLIVSSAVTYLGNFKAPRAFGNDDQAADLSESQASKSECPVVEFLYCQFTASYSNSMNLFGPLSTLVVEQFTEENHIENRLSDALAEYLAEDSGGDPMIALLVKQTLISLFRQSLALSKPWIERFGLVDDPQILRAFMLMAAKPGEPHTIEKLSKTVGLSRSAFMARFSKIVGSSPMAKLRELRLRRATTLLNAENSPVEQVAFKVGYRSRSSFVRAFRRQSETGVMANRALPFKLIRAERQVAVSE